MQLGEHAYPEFHEDFNFEDGNIVISASGNVLSKTIEGLDQWRPRTMLFRVHKSVMRTHSRTFADMLSLPASPDSHGETVESLPVVTMHDDLEDVIKLMKVIYYSE